MYTAIGYIMKAGQWQPLNREVKFKDYKDLEITIKLAGYTNYIAMLEECEKDE